MRRTGVEVRLVDYTVHCARMAAAAAKMSASTKPFAELFERMKNQQVEDWVKLVIMRGYTSVLEHCKYTFEVVCSRVCSHQLVRHRIASYTQQSMRWTEGFLREAALAACKAVGAECTVHPRDREELRDYIEALDYLAEMIEYREDLYNVAIDVVARAFVIPPTLDDDKLYEYIRTHLVALATYWWLVYRGVPREDARFVLPNSVKTRIVVTMNARELMESFLPLRLCRRAQWEIREVAWRMLWELRRVDPTVWLYAGPRCLRVAQLAGAECTLDSLAVGHCRLPIDKCPEGVPRDAIPRCVDGLIREAQQHW